MGRRYRKVLKNIVKDLNIYDIGAFIPDPTGIVFKFFIKESLRKALNIKSNFIFMSRRSAKHIIDKQNVGILLLRSIETVIRRHNTVYINNKGFSYKNNRFILSKKHKGYNIGVIIEIKEIDVWVVIAMILDEKYTKNKYKKLRLND